MRKEILESLTTLLPDEVYKKLLEASRETPEAVVANALCSLFFLSGMACGLMEAFDSYKEAREASDLGDVAFIVKLAERQIEVMKEITRIWGKLQEMGKEVGG